MIGRALLVSAFVLCSAATQAIGVASFKTPGGAVYCGFTEGEGTPQLLCWTPNDGYTISFGPKQRVPPRPGRYVAGNIDYHESTARLLRYGKSWSAGGFRCTSRTAGLTCVNQRDHGFWLGRYRGVRRF